MAQALQHAESDQQLALHTGWMAARRQSAAAVHADGRTLCAGCREKEARYGFQDDEDPSVERPRTLCFACFRVEIGRRQDVRARLARGWNAQQVSLPLEETLKELTQRRRRAQIAARRALGL
jgi:hypothetical protein